MSTFKHSQPMRPRYESAPYRQSPSRREHIYGRIQPMDDDRSVIDRLLDALRKVA